MSSASGMVSDQTNVRMLAIIMLKNLPIIISHFQYLPILLYLYDIAICI